MKASPVRIEEDRGVVHVVLDHGANAVDRALLDALRREVAALVKAGAPPLLLESSHPRIFSPGWDVKELMDADEPAIAAFLADFSGLVTELFAYPGPTAAAVGGHAIAGGCELAVACDFRIMAAGPARIGLSEVNLGVPVPAASLCMLQARLAPRAVEELVFHGDGCTAQRAHELGIVQRVVVDRGVSEVAEHELRTQLAKSPRAFRTIKRTLYEPAWEDCRRAIDAGAEDFLRCWFDDQTQERLALVVRRLRGRGER